MRGWGLGGGLLGARLLLSPCYHPVGVKCWICLHIFSSEKISVCLPVMGVLSQVHHALCILLPCANCQYVNDAVWTSVTVRQRSEFACNKQAEPKHEDSQQRPRKRWASSPKSTPGAEQFSPQITPIEKLLISIRSLNQIPSMSDLEACMPEINNFSRILSTFQVSTIFLSLSPRTRLQPWTLLFSLSKDGCSLTHLYNRLASFDCPLLLVIQVTFKIMFKINVSL